MKMKKSSQVAIVGIGLVIALVVYFKLPSEGWLKTTGEAVTAAELATNLQTDYTGYMADDTIPRIQSLAEFETVLPIAGSYAVVAPTDIVETGVYVKMPWWEPVFSAGTRKTLRNTKQPDVTVNSYYATKYDYSEYHLIKLPSGEYLLALMDRSFANALTKGEARTLPVGHKTGKLDAATDLLSPLLKEYEVTEKYVLYTCNNALYEKNELMATILRVGVAFGVFVVLMVAALLLFRKVFAED